MSVPSIGDAKPCDLAAVLALNIEFEQFLSPLDLGGLKGLAEKAHYFRVAKMEGCVVGFLIGFLSDADYDNANYRWFAQRFDNFGYVDRIVISAKAQGQLLGTGFYDDFGEFCRSGGIPRLVCEYNIRPKNEGSAKFHKAYGFVEVGQQDSGPRKRVSMQAYLLE